jgi:hypothetical protein
MLPSIFSTAGWLGLLSSLIYLWRNWRNSALRYVFLWAFLAAIVNVTTALVGTFAMVPLPGRYLALLFALTVPVCRVWCPRTGDDGVEFRSRRLSRCWTFASFATTVALTRMATRWALLDPDGHNSGGWLAELSADSFGHRSQCTGLGTWLATGSALCHRATPTTANARRWLHLNRRAVGRANDTPSTEACQKTWVCRHRSITGRDQGVFPSTNNQTQFRRCSDSIPPGVACAMDGVWSGPGVSVNWLKARLAMRSCRANFAGPGYIWSYPPKLRWSDSQTLAKRPR